MGQDSITSPCLAQMANKDSAKGQSPLQELEEGPHIGQYLQLHIILVIKRQVDEQFGKLWCCFMEINAY